MRASILAILSLLLSSYSSYAIDTVAMDCADQANPGIVVTYVIDTSKKLAQIKSQRFSPTSNPFYAAIVPVDITDDAYVVHTLTIDRKPFNEIAIGKVDGRGKVSNRPGMALVCNPSKTKEAFSEPTLVPNSDAMISVTCAEESPSNKGGTNVEMKKLRLDFKTKQVFVASGDDAPTSYGQIIDEGRDFVRICVSKECGDADGVETGILNLINGAYAVVRRSNGRFVFSSSNRSICRAQ